MKGQLKYYPRKKMSLVEAVIEAIPLFRDKYGYNPDYVICRKDEVEPDSSFPIDCMSVKKGCAPSHFYLCPIVDKRKPKVFNGDRKYV